MVQIVWAGLALPEAHAAPQTDFAIAVEGPRILATGARAELVAAYPAAEQVGASHYLLLPGFTNSHDHGRGLGTFPLGAPDDLLEIWLPGLYSQPAVPPYLLAAWESIILLRSGVTLTAHSQNPQSWLGMGHEAAESLRGYREAGVRVAFHPPLVDQNPLVYAERTAFLGGLPATLQETAQRFLRPNPLSHAEYFALCRDLHSRYHDAADQTVAIQVSPAGGQWCSDALILAAVEFAHSHNTRVQMHMLETRYQRDYAYRTWGKSSVAHLHEVGALGPWLTLAHMIWIEESDLALLEETGVAIAHNPGSNLRLRSGVAPVPAYLAHGIALGIGMDGQTLDDDQDFLRELRLALTLANRPGAHSPSVTAAEILHAGLAGGAAVTLGPDAALGRLAPGALADLVLIDWEAVCHPWISPLPSVADVLLRKAAQRHVRHVMVNGDWKLRDGRITHLDEEAIATAIAHTLNQNNPDDLAAQAAAAHALAPYLRRFYAAWEPTPSQVQPFF